MLTVDIYQLFSECFQQRERSRRVVDKSPAFSSGIEFPSEDAFLLFIYQIVFLEEIFQRRTGEVE